MPNSVSICPIWNISCLIFEEYTPNNQAITCLIQDQLGCIKKNWLNQCRTVIQTLNSKNISLPPQLFSVWPVSGIYGSHENKEKIYSLSTTDLKKGDSL